MPFQEREYLALPPDDTVIWRYMDLPKMLSLLEQRALYFAAITELGDSWEAVMAKRLKESIAQAHGAKASGDIVQQFRWFPRHLGVNCWYQGRGESIAMWKLYTTRTYGVALKSTVGRLKKAFARTIQEIALGKVVYEDHGKAPTQLVGAEELNAILPLFQKRPCFKHEHELRAVTVLEMEWPKGTEAGMFVSLPFPTQGMLVPVDLEVLIESLTLGPEFWARPLLQGALDRAGLNPLVVKSKILEPPDAEMRAF